MSKEKDFITMADLGNHIECPFCPQKDAKISDLEVKLAEMQNEKDELISKYRYWKGECAELKEQLAEKEKEAEDDEITRHMMCGDYTWTEMVTKLIKEVEEKEKEKEIETEIKAHHYTIQDIEVLKKQYSQSKISFAISELEKVKEYTDDVWWVDGVSEVICDFIDKQIDELKRKV